MGGELPMFSFGGEVEKCKNGSNNESYILQRFSGIFIRTVLFSCSRKVEVGYNLMRDL